MPAKGYDSVNLPSGLYNKVKTLVACKEELGYRSVTEFVAEAVRKRVEELERTNNFMLQLKGRVSDFETHKKEN